VFLEKSFISMFFGFFYPTIFYLPNHRQVFLEKSSISMFFGFFYPTIFYLPNHKQVFLEKYYIYPIFRLGVFGIIDKCFWILLPNNLLPNQSFTSVFGFFYPTIFYAIIDKCFWILLPNESLTSVFGFFYPINH
jgi:hypothetical protein